MCFSNMAVSESEIKSLELSLTDHVFLHKKKKILCAFLISFYLDFNISVKSVKEATLRYMYNVYRNRIRRHICDVIYLERLTVKNHIYIMYRVNLQISQ